MKRVSKLRASVRKAVGRSSLARYDSAASSSTHRTNQDLLIEDDALAVCRGVSLASLRALLQEIESGEAAPGVEVFESVRSSKRRHLKRGQTLKLISKDDEDEAFVVCRRAVHASEQETSEELRLKLGRDARQRARSDWTLEDVCQFVVLPKTQPLRGGVYAREAMHEDALGEPLQGAFVSAPRTARLRDLVDALERRFADCEPDEMHVWLDVLCANQVRAQNEEEDQRAATAELLRRARLTAARFEMRLAFMDSSLLVEPRPLYRTWCVWELLATAPGLHGNPVSGEMALVVDDHDTDDDGDDDDDDDDGANSVKSGATMRSSATARAAAAAAAWMPEPLYAADADATLAEALESDLPRVLALAASFKGLSVQSSRCRDAEDRDAILEALRDTGDGAKSTESSAADAALCSLASAWLAAAVLRAVDLKRDEVKPEDAAGWFGALLHHAGTVLDALDERAAALTLLTEALQVCRREMGNRTARVARVLRAVALCYQNAGQPAEALSFAEQALPVCQRKFGSDHLETADALNLVANCTAAEARAGSGAAKRAAAYYEQAIDIYRKQCGEDSPKVAMALNNAAHAFLREGDFKTAASYCEEALSIRRSKLGDAHPKLAGSLCNLGEIHRLQGDRGEAMRRFDEALGVHWEQLRRRHPAAAAQLTAVLEALCSDRDFRSALAKFEAAADISANNNRLAGYGDGSNNSIEALQQQQRRQKRRRSGGAGGAFRGVNAEVVSILSQKASVALEEGAEGHERALVFFSVALALAKQLHGERSSEVAGILEEMACLFAEMGQHDQSERLMASAGRIRRGSKSLEPRSKEGKCVVEQTSRQHSLLDTEPPSFL